MDYSFYTILRFVSIGNLQFERGRRNRSRSTTDERWGSARSRRTVQQCDQQPSTSGEATPVVSCRCSTDPHTGRRRTTLLRRRDDPTMHMMLGCVCFSSQSIRTVAKHCTTKTLHPILACSKENRGKEFFLPKHNILCKSRALCLAKFLIDYSNKKNTLPFTTRSTIFIIVNRQSIVIADR